MYKVKSLNQRLIKAYQEYFYLEELQAKLFVAKGFDGRSLLKFRKPQLALMNPCLLTNGEEAVCQIKSFLNENNICKIVIFSDYDCDGMTSAYIMHYALTTYCENNKHNAMIDVYFPERSEGYGLNSNWATALDASMPTLVITVDNGTNATEAVHILNERQIAVIVTDHHEPEEQIADCLIVNPACYADDPYKHLAGCGVAYKIGALLIGETPMLEVVDLLCVGTIGDMMPMTDENIAYCQLGLEKINKGQCHFGIAALKSNDSITYKDIAFEIAPKLNCCGRMGRMDLGKAFMFSPNAENSEWLTALNEERKTITKHYVGIAEEQQSTCVILESCGAGIAGIIAGQLSTKMHMNTIVLVGEGETLKGSARAFHGNVLEQIHSFKDKYASLFASGHEEACGISISREEASAFALDFDASQKSFVHQTDTPFEYLVDLELAFEDINNTTLHYVRSLPYDKDMLQEPIFVVTANLYNKERTKSNPDNVWLYLSAPNSDKKLKIWAQNMTTKAFNLKSKNNLKFIASIEKDFMRPDRTTLKIIDIIE